MKRYLPTDEAKEDMVGIQEDLQREAGSGIAKYMVQQIKRALVFLSGSPGAGHLRQYLTDDAVKFWPIYSYLVVYNPKSRPIQVLRIVHGNRDVYELLDGDE